MIDRDGDQHLDILFDLHKKSLISNGSVTSSASTAAAASGTGSGTSSSAAVHMTAANGSSSSDEEEVISVGQFFRVSNHTSPP